MICRISKCQAAKYSIRHKHCKRCGCEVSDSVTHACPPGFIKKRSRKQSPLPSKSEWTPFEKMLHVFGMEHGWGPLHKEYLFAKPRKWAFDYAFLPPTGFKIAIEIEGGAWISGRHNRGQGFLDDMVKYREAQILGWCLLRFAPQERDGGSILETLRRLV